MSDFKILVATDGSDPVLRACRTLVSALCPAEGTQIRVLTVVSFSVYPFPLTEHGGLSEASEHSNDVGAIVEHATRATAEIFETAGFKVGVVHRFGHPGDETLAEIAEWEPNLVVLGTRGLGPVGRLFGSVSDHVLHHANVPIFIAP